MQDNITYLVMERPLLVMAWDYTNLAATAYVPRDAS